MSKLKFRLLGLGFFATIPILLVMFTVVLYLFTSHHSEKEHFGKEPFLYQSLQYDPVTDEIFIGTVSIFQNIGPEDYLTSVDEAGKTVMISNFGTDEYKCTGTCYCEEDDFRRTSIAGKLSVPLVFFVAAITSGLAYNIAQRDFEKRCSEECNSVDGFTGETSSTVMSVVDNCGVAQSEDVSTKEQERKRSGMEEWTCIGTCLLKNSLRKYCGEHVCELDEKSTVRYPISPAIDNTYAGHYEKGDCGKMKLSGTVFVSVNKESKMIEKAMKKFSMDQLYAFCNENSRMLEDEMKMDQMKEILTNSDMKHDFYKSWCTSFHKDEDLLNNIKCRRKTSADFNEDVVEEELDQ